MGWKKTLRSMEAASRRAERDAQRRRRELEKQRKQLDKMQELERAAYEVEVYENYIDLLQSVHQQCSNARNWKAIQSFKPPKKPINAHSRKKKAQVALNEFKPGVFDKIMRRVEPKRDYLVGSLEKAKRMDEREYQKSLREYEKEYADWEATCELASKVLSGNANAYLDAIGQANLFSDIEELGSSIEFQSENSSLIKVTLHVCDEDVIPSEAKSLLKSGKLSVKQMPKGKFYELYQDYICGCVLRIARELFALLPTIKMVIVNAAGNLLNTKTGYMEEKPVLSVAIPRDTLKGLNVEMLDPSDSMTNFVHRMAFRKTKGFKAVEALKPSDLQSAG